MHTVFPIVCLVGALGLSVALVWGVFITLAFDTLDTIRLPL